MSLLDGRRGTFGRVNGMLIIGLLVAIIVSAVIFLLVLIDFVAFGLLALLGLGVAYLLVAALLRGLEAAPFPAVAFLAMFALPALGIWYGLRRDRLIAERARRDADEREIRRLAES